MRPTQTRCRTRRCGRGLNFNNFCHIYKRFRPPWRLHLVCAPPDFFVHNGTPILNVSCARCSFLSAPNEFLVEARQLELKGMSSRCRRGKRCSGIETVCSAGCLSDAHTFRGTRAVALDWKMRRCSIFSENSIDARCHGEKKFTSMLLCVDVRNCHGTNGTHSSRTLLFSLL